MRVVWIFLRVKKRKSDFDQQMASLRLQDMPRPPVSTSQHIGFHVPGNRPIYSSGSVHSSARPKMSAKTRSKTSTTTTTAALPAPGALVQSAPQQNSRFWPPEPFTVIPLPDLTPVSGLQMEALTVEKYRHMMYRINKKRYDDLPHTKKHR